MKTDYKNKQITSADKGVQNKSTKAESPVNTGKNTFNFPPSATAPAMHVEAESAREAEEIYQKKIAALPNNN